MTKTILLALLIGLTFNASAYAIQDSKKVEHTPSTQQLLSNLQKEIEATTLAIAKNESSKNKDITELNYAISLPEKQYANLGLLVNLTIKDQGYQVISVTPGSDAYKLGIRVNDFIQKIDGVNVGELSKKAVIGTLYKVNPDDVISLGVESKGVYQEIVVKIHGVLLPAIRLNVGKN
ncbi:PDZ domain-containing protein [Colwellia sp. 1_MG-2023]|uniref:PDZ domain-containing protein n=1 Tax=Colwellia sp. 1_MG-2023 TaxID=3062649 RepID=UPI0026E2373C|nr:PDZ domain-containing protein [Colwellia sp. 1_MG-2023]MDO6445510.1 PDZ domain-containing protein [Colwellia sp. 1_MG-2023]